MTNAHKKNVDLYVFIGFLRSSTTYPSNYNVQAHASWRERAALPWMDFHEVVEVSENQCKLLRFFLFYDVHNYFMWFIP